MKTLKKILVGMLAFCFVFLACSINVSAAWTVTISETTSIRGIDYDFDNEFGRDNDMQKITKMYFKGDMEASNFKISNEDYEVVSDLYGVQWYKITVTKPSSSFKETKKLSQIIRYIASDGKEYERDYGFELEVIYSPPGDNTYDSVPDNNIDDGISYDKEIKFNQIKDNSEHTYTQQVSFLKGDNYRIKEVKGITTEGLSTSNKLSTSGGFTVSSSGTGNYAMKMKVTNTSAAFVETKSYNLVVTFLLKDGSTMVKKFPQTLVVDFIGLPDSGNVTYDENLFTYGPNDYTITINHPATSATVEYPINSKGSHDGNDPVQKITKVEYTIRDNRAFSITSQTFSNIDNYDANNKITVKVDTNEMTDSFDMDEDAEYRITFKGKDGASHVVIHKAKLRVIYNKNNRTTQSNDDLLFSITPQKETVEFTNNRQVKVYVNKKPGSPVDSVSNVNFTSIPTSSNYELKSVTYHSTGSGNGYITFTVVNNNVDEAWEEVLNLVVKVEFKTNGQDKTNELPYELTLRYNKDGALDQDDDADDDDSDGDDVTLYGDPDDLSRILDVNDGVGKVVYDFALLVAAILTFLGIMWVGVNIVMARANGEQRSSSMQGLMYIVIGIIILDIVLVLYGLLGDLVGDPESEVDQLDVTVVGGDED